MSVRPNKSAINESNPVRENSSLNSFAESSGELGVNKHSDAVMQQKMQEVASQSPQINKIAQFQQQVNQSPAIVQMRSMQQMISSSLATSQLQQMSGQGEIQLEAKSDEKNVSESPIQKVKNTTGLPDSLKSGIENLSGHSMDDVKVHYNSNKPAQLQAHAYAQGTNIHLASGQEKHLPHEAWHVVQQKQGRVKPTLQMKGNVPVNDDTGLEKEADEMGAKALQLKSNPVLEGNEIQAQPIFSKILKSDIAQRSVIQLQYDADAKLVLVQSKRDQALVEIKAGEYENALVLYATIKEITKDLNERRAISTQRDRVYNRHSNGSMDCLTGIIKAFQEVPQLKVDELAIKYSELFNRYEPKYNQAYDQISNLIGDGIDHNESNSLLIKLGKEHLEKSEALDKLLSPILGFDNKVANDSILEYSMGKNREATQVGGSRLKSLNLAEVKIAYKDNRALDTNYKTHNRTIVLFEKDPENQSLQKETVLSLLAGSKKRLTKIADAVGKDFHKQLKVFRQINKNHRSDSANAVVKLIKDVGLENLDLALQLIDKVGAKGSIAQINLYQEKIRATKAKPDMAKAIGFLTDLEYPSLDKLTPFVTEVGKLCSLGSLKSIWAQAYKNDNLIETALFAGNHIPASMIGSEEEAGLAFASKTGKSKAADWGKLLAVPNWAKENLFALALAFDKNDGNATAEQWVKVAKKDDTLKTKPDEVRATARLNMFANEDWYDKYDTSKKGSSSKKAKKKYTQLLYALLGDIDLSNLGGINFGNIKGDFLSMLVFFHRHIASFDSGKGQGFDREEVGGGKYARSNQDHPLNQQYKDLLSDEGVDTRKLIQPLNSKLLKLQEKERGITKGKKGNATYRTGRLGVASAGLPSHNLKILQDQQEIIGTSGDKKKALKGLFQAPKKDIKVKASRTIADPLINEELLKKQEEAQKGNIGPKHNNKNFHDGLLEDRGKMVSKISTVINSISGGNQVLNAIGSGNHPSLILKVPKPNQFKYDNKSFANTKKVVPTIVHDFNAAPNQEIKVTERGSFGFQRPTVADTGDSVRLWLGYAPVESLLPGLKVVVTKLNNKKPNTDLTKIDDIDKLKTDTGEPVLYMEALKTAMRHTFIVLKEKVDVGASTEKKRVYEWLKTRLLIKLQQAGILLEKGATLYDGVAKIDQKERNKHFNITADMTDKLQEYSMMFAAATLGNSQNPNSDHTKTGNFKDGNDTYEKNVVSKLGATDYRIFYLDSGEQALVSAGILANRFQKGKDETDKKVTTSKYISRNPYFEIGVFGGDRRSNLEKDDVNGKIVHADLSPVITSGITAPKPKSDIQKDVRETWQNPNGTIQVDDMIPIIDITNSSIDDVVSLGNMPQNFIVVESLTKHQQLGADKFIMGRLIAVSKTKGTAGNNILDKTNFLDLAQKIIGPVSNEAYNPLLAKIRANMDKALYSDEIS